MKWIVLAGISLILVPFHQLFAADASLYMLPQKIDYAVDDIFTVMILADTGGETVSAAEGDISYSTSGLELVSVSTDGSLLATWSTDPVLASKPGLVRFAGWADEPFEGGSALLLTLTFKATANTPGNIQYVSGVLLSSEALGSNIVSMLRSGVYTAAPRKVTEVAPEIGLDEIESTVSSNEEPLQLPVVASALPPPSPQITRYDKIVRSGGKIHVEGESVPGTNVHIWTADSSGQAVAITVRADEQGVFLFESPESVASGVYRMYAVSEDERGIKSEPTERIVVNVTPSNLAVAFLAIDTLGGMLIPMLLTLVIAGLLLGYLMFRKTRDSSYQYEQ